MTDEFEQTRLSSFPHRNTDEPVETLHPDWLMELMERATIDLRRHPQEGLWDFLERKADYFKLQNARYDEKLANLNRSPEQENTYRNEVTRDGFRYTRSNDAEKILLRNQWEQENLRQGTHPGAFDLDEDGQLKTRLIEINFKHIFDDLHGTPALAEWNNMLLARLLPPEDYVQIMSLPKAQRWHAIDEQTEARTGACAASPRESNDKPNTFIREKDGEIGYFRLTDEQSHRSDELTAGSSEENSPEWILAAQGRRHTGYDIRTPYGTHADKKKYYRQGSSPMKKPAIWAAATVSPAVA